jgi:hypothetical protein
MSIDVYGRQQEEGGGNAAQVRDDHHVMLTTCKAECATARALHVAVVRHDCTAM